MRRKAGREHHGAYAMPAVEAPDRMHQVRHPIPVEEVDSESQWPRSRKTANIV